MRSHAMVMLLGLSLATPSGALCQPLAAGDVVQLRARRLATTAPWESEQHQPTWRTGVVVRLTHDVIWFRADGSRRVEEFVLSDAEVRRATGRDRRGTGAVVGGAVGGAIGALAAYVTFEPEYKVKSIGAGLVCALNDCTPTQSNSRAGVTAVGGLGGAALGFLAGYFIGRTVGRWESVELAPAVALTGAFSMQIRVAH